MVTIILAYFKNRPIPKICLFQKLAFFKNFANAIIIGNMTFFSKKTPQHLETHYTFFNYLFLIIFLINFPQIDPKYFLSLSKNHSPHFAVSFAKIVSFFSRKELHEKSRHGP